MFALSLLLMAGAVWEPTRRLITGVIILEILSCLLDQNRWQPWEYQFILMAFVYAGFEDHVKIKSGWLIILSGIYFFSGLSKLSPDFIHDTWQWLILNRWLGLHTLPGFVYKFGYVIPLVEIATGILILLPNWRKLSFKLILVIHIFNLILLGPTGLNINAVIWPWNVLMPLLAYYLFRVLDQHGPERKSNGVGIKPLPKGIQFSILSNKNLWEDIRIWLLVILCWILPFGMSMGYWDRYLSFTLYSGGVPQLMICSNDHEIDVIAPGSQRINSRIPCDDKLLAAWDWGMKAMKTAPYPEMRVYRKIAEDWKKAHPVSRNRFFIVRSGFNYRVEEMK